MKGKQEANNPDTYVPNRNTVRGKVQTAIDGRKLKVCNGFSFYVNDTAYMNEQAFGYFLDSQFKFRAGRSGLDQPRSAFVVDDLKSHYTAGIKEKLRRYNTKLIVIPGGLTPKAQLCDTHVNFTFKHHVKSQQTTNRLEQFREAKARAQQSGIQHASAYLKKLDRVSKVSHVQVMIYFIICLTLYNFLTKKSLFFFSITDHE